MNQNENDKTRTQHKLSGSVKDNIDLIADFYAQEESHISTTQNIIEKVSAFFSTPLYLSILVLFVSGWIVINSYAEYFHVKPFDTEPFVMLHGIVGFNALVITIAVLVRQNRLEKLAEKRDHLSLQATLIAEQKATKIIKLLEDLRTDLPNVKNRIDPEAEDMKIETNPHEVLNAIDAPHGLKKGL